MLDFTKFGILLGITWFTKKKTIFYQVGKWAIFSCEGKECKWIYVTLHGKTGIKVIARSQHASTLKQKNLYLTRLKHVQEHTSLASYLFGWTQVIKKRTHTNNAVKQEVC